MLRPDPLTAPTAPALAADCRVCFGAHEAEITSAPALHVALPVLGGTGDEILLTDGVLARGGANCTLFRQTSLLAGFAIARHTPDLEVAARDLYHQLFAATSDRHLYRIWNYVPHINAIADGMENYRRFCRGRSLAFEEHFGASFERQLPAASGVGTMAGPLAIAFLAGDAEPRHFENPQQVPAFKYPSAYGPRAPSFSRATRVAAGKQEQVFISGTAAIRGHATESPGRLTGQLSCTVENLQLIGEAAGAGREVGAREGWQRSFKIFLRHGSDLAKTRTYLERHLLRPDDEVIWLQADVCRAELLLEIEAVLTRPV